MGVDHVIRCGGVVALCSLLEYESVNVVAAAVEVLEKLLQRSRQEQLQNSLPTNQVAQLVCECGGDFTLSLMQSADNIFPSWLRKKSLALMTTYFAEEKDEWE